MSKVSKDYIQYLYEHNIDIATKTLYLGYGSDEEVELDHVVAAEMIKGLHLLSHIRPDDMINIIINCEGGSVDHGLAIYDAIKSTPAQVTATVVGMAHSMAAWVLQAADIRRMTKSSSIMIHDGAGPKNAYSRRQDKLCNEIMLDRIREKNPKFSMSQLQKMLDKDTYFTAEEALDLGLIDEII